MQENTIRINKYLANLGVCARRDVKDLLKKQELLVNGERVLEQGVRIDPQKDLITLNGKPIKPPELEYYLLNKPKGIISTTSDEFGRKNVTSLIPSKARIYPVGRLDKDTTGLIILTNDGDLTNLLTHPRFHVYKVYKVTVSGFVDRHQLKALRNGVLLNDGITAPAQIKIVQSNPKTTIFEITIHEGRNRQIRRMCETVGLALLELERIQFGPIKNSPKLGKWRKLTQQEIKNLRNASLQKA